MVLLKEGLIVAKEAGMNVLIFGEELGTDNAWSAAYKVARAIVDRLIEAGNLAVKVVGDYERYWAEVRFSIKEDCFDIPKVLLVEFKQMAGENEQILMREYLLDESGTLLFSATG